MTSISKAFEYLGSEECFVIDAQKALSGCPRNSVGPFVPPNVEHLIGLEYSLPHDRDKLVIDKSKLDIWIDRAFMLPSKDFHKDGKLREVAKVAFATLLIHADKFVEDIGGRMAKGSHCLLQTFKKLDIRFDDVRDWGILLKKNFDEANIMTTVVTQDALIPTTSALAKLAVEVNGIKCEMTSLKGDFGNLKREFRAFKQVETLFRLYCRLSYKYLIM